MIRIPGSSLNRHGYGRRMYETMIFWVSRNGTVYLRHIDA
jgi:hypothetical protein